jgi:hypothetical protein
MNSSVSRYIRVLPAELKNRLRNGVAVQLTENPAREASRGVLLFSRDLATVYERRWLERGEVGSGMTDGESWTRTLDFSDTRTREFNSSVADGSDRNPTQVSPLADGDLCRTWIMPQPLH